MHASLRKQIERLEARARKAGLLQPAESGLTSTERQRILRDYPEYLAGLEVQAMLQDIGSIRPASAREESAACQTYLPHLQGGDRG